MMPEQGLLRYMSDVTVAILPDLLFLDLTSNTSHGGEKLK
jgi:hypothetical protein